MPLKWSWLYRSPHLTIRRAVGAGATYSVHRGDSAAGGPFTIVAVVRKDRRLVPVLRPTLVAMFPGGVREAKRWCDDLESLAGRLVPPGGDQRERT